ncbi:MAG: helix-turn-helix domain-containing protein [Anaerolineales bacterium]
MAEKTRFGALLKHYRQAAGLTQEALADQAGLSVRAISDLERGVNRAPRYATLKLLAGALPLSAQQQDLLKAAAQPEAGDPPVGAVRRFQPSIPLPPTRLVGRDADHTRALDLLRSEGVRLLTLSGPSGVGKTRLALQLAQDLAPDFADGSVFIPLATIGAAELVPGTVAQALRIQETPSVSTRDQVISFLGDKQMLLVLDNLEQVLDCSPFVANLLAHCPRLTILATSRAALRLRAEHEYLLAPLPLEEAVTLFCERARAVQPGGIFPADEVAPICEQLDCLPLAIELAAMRCRVLALPELRKQLVQRFALLRGGARDLPARQQTMEDAIAWSYELLTEAQKHCFRRLGVFVGGWTLEAAEAVCWAEGEMAVEERLLTIAALVEASLVQTETEAGGVVRFSMLELIREYALERLREAGEAGTSQHQHAAYYARLAETAEALFEVGPMDRSLSLARELANVGAALQWVETNRQVELGLQLSGFIRLWHVLGQPSQAVRWLERVLELDQWARTNGTSPVPLALRVEKLCGLGRALLARGQIQHAQTATTEALRLAQQTGDEKGMTNAWANVGMIAQASGELDRAEEAFNQSGLHAGEAGDDRLQYRAMVHQAEIARGRGKLARAAILLQRALEKARVQQMSWDVAIITTLLGHLAYQQQNYPLAKANYRESLQRLAAFSSPTYIAWCLEGCAAVLCAERDAVPAVRLSAAAANLRKQADTPLPDSERQAFEQVVAKARNLLGEVAFQQEWAPGASLSQGEAIAFALGELG